MKLTYGLVRSVYFSFLVLVMWQQKFGTTGCKTTEKLQLSSAQAGMSSIRQTLQKHGSRPIPKESFWWSLLASPCLYFLSPLLRCALCKIGLVAITNQWKGMQIGIRSRLIDKCKLHTAGSVVCLPITQTQFVIIMCVCVFVCVCV